MEFRTQSQMKTTSKKILNNQRESAGKVMHKVLNIDQFQNQNKTNFGQLSEYCFYKCSLRKQPLELVFKVHSFKRNRCLGKFYVTHFSFNLRNGCYLFYQAFIVKQTLFPRRVQKNFTLRNQTFWAWGISGIGIGVDSGRDTAGDDRIHPWQKRGDLCVNSRFSRLSASRAPRNNSVQNRLAVFYAHHWSTRVSLARIFSTLELTSTYFNRGVKGATIHSLGCTSFVGINFDVDRVEIRRAICSLGQSTPSCDIAIFTDRYGLLRIFFII